MFRIIPEAKDFSEYVLLRDGQSVCLRTATEADIPAVESLMQTVSRESLQMRFMGAVSYVSRNVIETLCGGDPRERLSLLAIVGQQSEARVVGIGNYISLGVGHRAEVAFLVQDEYQGRGISTLLLERLAGIAAAFGFVVFEAEVLYENTQMINVFRDSGFEVHQAMDGGSIHVAFPVGGRASLRERVELRDRIAAANSLVPLLQPRTVAVVGASRDGSSIGSLIFRSILRGNFSGTAYPVNRQAIAVHGVRAYASLSDLPERADLVVLTVPAEEVLSQAEAALRAGTKGLLVLTSGFAETGPEGAAQQQKLVGVIRSHGARMIGPNCLGIINAHPEMRLNASLAPNLPPAGRIGFYSHSAALGIVILNYAAERGLGFSSFVSAGNRADVSGNDLLQFWEEDPSTDIALLYLETFGNARNFARIARRVSYRKPVLCVKSARSRAGSDMARAHIGAAAHSDPEVDVLFRQAGVIRAGTLEELFDVAALLSTQPLPRGNRAAIISNSGGVLTICADACESNGLAVAASRMIDLGPLTTVAAYERVVQQTMEDEEVDSLIAMYACVGDCDPDQVGRGIRRAVVRAERKSGVPKPAVLCLMGAAGAVQFGAERGARRVFPSYRFPESAALALARASQYAAFRRQPGGRILWYDDIDPCPARQRVQAMLDAATEPQVWLEGENASDFLQQFGIHTEPGVAATDTGSVLHATLGVKSDPSFGPLISLMQPGKPRVVRITPLTDRDIQGIIDAVGIPPGCGVDELLGRVSQLIEELPWICEMQAEMLYSTKDQERDLAVLGRSPRIGFCRQV